MASSQDYGQDLPDVQNLRKKMQRLLGELKNHDPIVQQILENGKKFQEENPSHEEEIQAKCSNLLNMWNELNALSEDRYNFPYSVRAGLFQLQRKAGKSYWLTDVT